MMWRWRKRPAEYALLPFTAAPPVQHDVPAWRAAALALSDGAPLGDALASELRAEMLRRAADVTSGWSVPALSGLHVRQAGTPERWTANRNLFLTVPGSPVPALFDHVGLVAAVDSVIAIGAGVQLHHADAGGNNALLAVGDGARLGHTSLSVGHGATVLIGEHSSSTFMASVDGRNGGRILVGADSMWANGIRMISDDMHAILDLTTGKRINRRGGTIIVEPHVWLGEHVMVMADCRIGHDTVVGANSLVRGTALPANTVCAGAPLRVLRTGTTWSREDIL